jgi:predicted transcriptional regulator
MRYFIEETDSIILNIQSIHAGKIYSGQKTFELRKVIPTKRPEIVFLYEQNGTKAITGAFLVKRIVNLPLNDLWKLVGNKGTTKERFYSYFNSYSLGNAYEIDEIIKFQQALSFEDIIELAPNFRHPQSFVYLKSFPKLKEKLFNELNRHSIKKSLEITFEPPSTNEETQFKSLALQEISKNYDEIDDSFVDNIVKCSRLGIDKNGYFTKRKILYSIKLSKKTIGYIVITEKIGNSIKTGPTILLPEFRNIGLGREIRRLVEDIYKKLGFRKIYCTCNSTDFSVIRYLIKSGMKVEAHLSGQYKKRNSELIFGKLLKTSEKKYLHPVYKKLSGRTTLLNKEIDRIKFVEFLCTYFKYSYLEIDPQFAKKLVKSNTPQIGKYSQKTKSIFITKDDKNEIVSISICSPKRGGSVKINFITISNHEETFKEHISNVTKHYINLKRSKVYTTIPIYDLLIIKFFENYGFKKEGLLIEPYQDGIDMILLSMPLTKLTPST